MIDAIYPKLRSPLQVTPMVHAGQPVVLLRDPLELTPRSLLVPRELAPLLGLVDGSRPAHMLSVSLALRHGLSVSQAQVDHLLASLDEALFLENERFQAACRQALQAYRQAPFRPLACAPHVYPADPAALRGLLAGFLAQAGDQPPAPDGAPLRGLISPHIDYARGGLVYARAWQAAARLAQEAELAVIFGTDHYGGEDPFTLTRQHYATPYGTLPTDQAGVTLLSAALGELAAFGGEIRHRGEHSIELAAVWLHHLRQGKPLPLLPVLCGGHEQLLQAGEALVADFLAGLEQAIGGRRAILIAAADLAHVGPAFGGPPLDPAGRAALRAADDELLERICAGDADGFLQAIRRVEDCNQVCGVSPIYLLLRALEKTTGRQVAYDACPADAAGASTVTICGVVFE
jgi:hypothetical protein